MRGAIDFRYVVRYWTRTIGHRDPGWANAEISPIDVRIATIRGRVDDDDDSSSAIAPTSPTTAALVALDAVTRFAMDLRRSDDDDDDNPTAIPPSPSTMSTPPDAPASSVVIVD